VEIKTSNLAGKWTIASRSTQMTNSPQRVWSGLHDPFFKFGSPSRILQMAEARVVKLCIQVGYMKC